MTTNGSIRSHSSILVHSPTRAEAPAYASASAGRHIGMFRVNVTRGFSLMETVVYVSLVAFISILVVQSIVLLLKTFKEVRLTRDIGSSAIVALDRISKEVRQADALGAGGVFSATTSKLVLTYSGPPVATKEFSVDVNRTLRLTEDGVDSGALTSPNISVESFWVDQATTSSKMAFRITLIMKDRRVVTSQEIPFYSAAAMRNLY